MEPTGFWCVFILRWRLWTFSAGVGAGLTAALGVFVGLATWIYLSLVLAVRHRR